MAELVKLENNLLAIKVRLRLVDSPSAADTAGSSPNVRFKVSVGANELGKLEYPLESLGIHRTTDLLRGDTTPDTHIAPDVATALSDLVNRPQRSDPLLWLHLAAPTGVLALLGWEQMLGEVFPYRPIVRVPNFTSFPTVAVDYYDLVICAGSMGAAQAKQIAFEVAQLANQLASRLSGRAVVHVFPDREVAPHLGQLDVGGAKVYPLPDRSHPDPADHASPVQPWIDWINKSLPGRSVDFVHFVAEASASGDEPTIGLRHDPSLLRLPPTRTRMSQTQIGSITTRVSAWGVGTSAPSTVSPTAARLLVERLAHLRSGPILLHEFGSDSRAFGIAEMYDAITAHRPPERPSSIAAYCHPRLLTPDRAAQFQGISAPTLEPSISSWLDLGPNDEPWVVGTQRTLEQSVATLFPEQAEGHASTQQDAVAKGVAEAMRVVHGIVTKFGSETSSAASPAPAESGHDREETLA